MTLTRARTIQYVGILLALFALAAGYWYFSVRADVKINSAGSQSQGTEDLSAGLSGYWRFDEGTGTTAADASLNGNAATLTNGPTWTTGHIGSGVQFDGTNDYTVASYSGTTLTQLTISLWVNPSSTPGSQVGMFQWANAVTAAFPFVLITQNSSSNMVVYMDQGYNCSTSVSNNTWTQVTVTLDTSNLWSCYKNGVLFGTYQDNATHDYQGNAASLYVGNGYNGYFAGKADELRVYNRAFSANEVENLYRLTVDTGLRGHWSFDGDKISGTTAIDRSGLGNNGTLTNGPVKKNGRVGQALEFDGTNDYVDAGSAPALDDIVNLTACAWINPDTIPGGYTTVVAKSNTSVGWALEVYGGGGDLEISFIRHFSTLKGEWTGNTGTLPLGVWQHVCVTYNDTSTANDPTLYVNGTPVSFAETSTPSGTAVSDASNALSMGVLDGGTGPFDGKIDEVRVYNRILSSAEVKGLYDAGSANKVNTSATQSQGAGRLDSGLAAYWKLDENTGTSAADASTNAIAALTLTNGPAWVAGQIDSAIDFDGSDDYATTPDTAVLDFGDTDDFTLSGWFNRESFNTVDTVLAKRDSNTAGDAGYIVSIDNSTDLLQLEVSDGGDEYSLTSTASFTAAGWNHFAIIWDQDSPANSEIYINGVANNATDAGTIGNVGDLSNAVAFRLGAESDNGNPFDGKIDEIRIYDRALSADEIIQLHRLTSPTGVDTGLKGYWSFDGQALSGTILRDLSGARNAGTLTNGPVQKIGRVGQALDFDGSNDYVGAGSDSSIDNLVQKTTCAWVYPESIPSTFGTVLGKMDTANSDGWQFEMTDNDGNNRIGMYQVFNGTSGTWKSPVDSVPFNAWTHACISYDDTSASNNPIIYINGVSVPVEEISTPSGTAVSDAAATFRIGAITNSVIERFDGKIDEARIYSRILSESEVKALYDAGSPDKANTSAGQAQGTGRLDSDLFAYWKLDENTGTSASDASTNGITGTLTNGPSWATGRINSAVTFDGTNDHIVATNSRPTFNSHTSCAWVKPNFNDTNTDYKKVMVRQATAGDNDRSSMIRWSGIDSYWFSDSKDAYLYTMSDAYARFNSGEWHNICFSYDASDTRTGQFYWDGAPQPTTEVLDLATTNDTASMPFYIGSGVGSEYFDGTIDEARVYSRALSRDEVADLYRLTAPTGTDTSLKGYWPFNGQDVIGTTAYDRSGTGSNGTLTNGPIRAIGKVGQGLSFDGSNDYIGLGNPTNLQLTGSMTVSTWAKIQGTPDASDYIAISKSDGGNTDYGWMFAAGTVDNGPLQSYFEVAINASSVAQRYLATTLSTNTWYHIVGVYDASAQTINIYLNGTLNNGTLNGTVPASQRNATTGARIGARPNGAGVLNGTLDELRVYNRALSASEINGLYAAGR